MDVIIRVATHDDLAAIIRLLAADEITGKREHFPDPLLPAYEKAFHEVSQDANNELLVAELSGAIVGTLQLTFIPNLTQQGGKRALVEPVFVDVQCRARGVDKKLMHRAVERAREQHCRMIQLTTNKARHNAQRFYESLGFTASHVGMKLLL